jgi:hypothetical protein
MQVLDLDFESAIRDISRLPDALRRGLDHLPRRELLQFPGGLERRPGDRLAKSGWSVRAMRAASPSNHPSK